MIQTNKYPDMEEVIITSKNPVKINATVKAFETLFKNVKFTYKGVSVPSEVPDQPIGYEETLKGAENRVKNAKEEYADAAYWVGIERSFTARTFKKRSRRRTLVKGCIKS